MTNPKVEVYSAFFREALKSTLSAASKVAEQNRYKQFRQGKAHPLWLIGHLANTNNLIVNMWALGGQPVIPKEYAKLFAPDFAGGDPIVPDPAKYPAWEAVLANYTKAEEACIAAIERLTDADLAGDSKGNVPDPMKQTFGKLENTLRIMAGHESHHRGQLAMLANAKD